MNKPSGSEYPSITPYAINNSTVLNQVYTLVQQLNDDVQHVAEPLPPLCPRLRSRFLRSGCLVCGNHLANHAVLRRYSEQCVHSVAVEPDHHWHWCPNGRESGYGIHKHPAKWRSDCFDKMTMSNPVAEFVEVSKIYRAPLRPSRTVQALREVSFEIAAGEVFALLGPNRAGKTTLLKVLLGLCHPSSGRVSRLGRPLTERRTLARVGYMHENQAFPRYLTATTLLELYGGLSWMSPSVLHLRPIPCSVGAGWTGGSRRGTHWPIQQRHGPASRPGPGLAHRARCAGP